jgi:gluconolactonase
MPVTLATIGADIDHPEGVCWHPEGTILVGTEAGRLLWLDPGTGKVQRTMEVGSGFIGGVAVDGRGRAYACDLGERRVVRADPATGSVETYSTGPVGRPFGVPNYPVFDRSGRLYVSDSGEWGAADGRVVVVEPDRTARLISSEPAAFTNGLALSPDGAWLYVVESSLPGISRLPLGDDGSAGPRELVVELPRTVPDGLAFTHDGRMLISFYRPDLVSIWDGSSLEPVAEDWTGLTLSAPTNVAFGGPALDQLYAANLAATHVTRIDAGLRGAPLHLPDLP